MTSEYIKKILGAQVYDVAIETPISEAGFLSKRIKNKVLIKREDLQPVFSFKLRGAYNKMVQLSDEEKERGVVAASAGNHAQGVALAANKLGMAATIVMPTTTPKIKVISVKARGGNVVLFGDNFDEALGRARQLEKELGLVFIHPYDDPEVIAGQGTIGMEICRQISGKIDAVFIPVGGGGLVAGIGTYIKYLRPEIKVIAVESEESACLKAAFDAGERTPLDKVGIFADGVAVKLIGEETYKLCLSCVDEVITVNTDEICAAIKDLFEDTRSIAEPAGALGLAGLKKYAEENGLRDKTLLTIESGANVNFDKLRYISEVSEIGELRECLLGVKIPEKPGSFRTFCQVLDGHSITEFNYRLRGRDNAHILVGVQLKRKAGELTKVIKELESKDYEVVDLTKDQVSKLHIRNMVGGHLAADEPAEMVYSIDFPERAGALTKFLDALEDRWNISLFHYRNEGSVFGQVLLGLQCDVSEEEALCDAMSSVGFNFSKVENNPAYDAFLSAD